MVIAMEMRWKEGKRARDFCRKSQIGRPAMCLLARLVPIGGAMVSDRGLVQPRDYLSLGSWDGGSSR